MNDSNSSSGSTTPRPTLKLKVAPRKAAPEPTAKSADDLNIPPAPRAQGNPKTKSGAHWSDEYKSRMQADMDALVRR
jgi:hypothetical protein